VHPHRRDCTIQRWVSNTDSGEIASAFFDGQIRNSVMVRISSRHLAAHRPLWGCVSIQTFSTTTLRLLTQAEVFFAKPSTFNDPFDCNPEVLVDVEWRYVERLWKSNALRQMGKAGLVEKMAGYHLDKRLAIRHILSSLGFAI